VLLSVVHFVQLILLGVEEHPMELGVQMAATACLYNLSLGEMGQKVHPYLLSRIIHCTLNAMENFPNHQQVRIPDQGPSTCSQIQVGVL